jgi:ribonucleoside-diphosphate reductase alpha chain
MTVKGDPSRQAEKADAEAGNKKPGLKIRRKYTKEGSNVWDTVAWERRTASITNENGEIIFEQKDCEIPANWSLLATNVVVSKYFRGAPNSPKRENSVRQMVGRVVETFTQWGYKDGYFASAEDRDTFRDELTHMLLHQKLSFNSPVWFNVGVEEKPQCSACFINSIEDSMESILGLAKTEGMLFKFGSGTGSNLSSIRGSHEGLSA